MPTLSEDRIKNNKLYPEEKTFVSEKGRAKYEALCFHGRDFGREIIYGKGLGEGGLPGLPGLFKMLPGHGGVHCAGSL